MQLLFDFAKVTEDDRVYLTWVCEFWEDQFPLPIGYYLSTGMGEDADEKELLISMRERSRKIDRFINKYFKKKTTMKLSDMEIREYRSLVGLQLQYAEAGDTHKVMEMQMVLVQFIIDKVKFEVSKALALLMNDRPIVVAMLTNVNLAEYALKNGKAFEIYDEFGFGDEWKKYQAEIEEWIGNLIDERVLEITKPFLKISKQ